MSNCLYVIDMQAGFMGDHTKHLTAKIRKLLDRELFSNVAFAQFYNDESTALVSLLNWRKFMNSSEVGKLQQVIAPELSSHSEEVFRKSVYSGVTTEFRQFLRDRSITEVYLVGLYTHTCVLHTAFDLFALGVKPVIVSDLCLSSSEVLQTAALMIAADNFGSRCVINYADMSEWQTSASQQRMG